jgi:YfiH family protein
MNDLITFEAPLLRGRFIVFNQKPEFDLLKVKQIHSDIIVNEDQCQSQLTEADGIIGSDSVPKAILTADCVPLVLIGKDSHVVIHAGWRGLAQNILSHELIKNINPIYAFIGPHIRPEHYEVQSDFLANFPHFQEAFTKQHGNIYFNLAYVATEQLRSAFSGIVIEDCGLCTYSNLKFHSFRRDKTIKRNWNIYFPQ